jgi:hypothetical protein
MDSVLGWLSGDYGFELSEDVRSNAHYQQIDVDLIMNNGFLEKIPVEVKIRIRYRPDIAVETQSNKEKGTQGYIYKSKASYLAYCYVTDGKLDTRSTLLYLPSLKVWFKAHIGKYAPKLAPNPPDNPLYHTEFYPVPLTDIPIHVFATKVSGRLALTWKARIDQP